MNQKVLHIMTIANSIIGVGILAMPYCFKQCGIFLSICILIASSAVSRLSCHLLLKSAIIARRKTFENLAFHAFGSLGKFIIEIGIIGFLLGTCIAFFVVMGDLGPAIVSKVSGTHSTGTVRTSLLMALALFCVLPLGLLRNVDSLTSVSTASVGFYFCLVAKVITEAGPHLFSGDWTSKVSFWRPAGILQCLPIFTMALFCQTQIFEIYQAIPNASLDKMNELIRAAVNICTGAYIFVGTFGYIAFSNQPFTGNILMSFTPSIVTDAMSIGFVLSLAFSFPLVIFPCRASLYSLLYKQVYSSLDAARNYIPEGRFKFLTFIIVFISLLTGVLIPNIELVLGLVGSTIGILICVIFPATCFICISTKNTNERIAAQGMLFIGIIVMVLGTYANLYAIEQTTVTGTPIVEIHEPEILKIVKDDTALRDNAIDIPSVKTPVKSLPELDEPRENKNAPQPTEKAPSSLKEVRQEPPQPVEPEDVLKNDQEQVQFLEGGPVKSILEQQNKSFDVIPKLPEEKLNADVKEPKKDIPKTDQLAKMEDTKMSVEKTGNKDQGKIPEKRDEVDINAIRKEEKEMDQNKEGMNEDKSKLELLKTLEKQQEVQKQLLETQRELLGQIKKQNIKDDGKQKEIAAVNQDEIKKAVKEIESIAKKAIESLSNKKTEDNLNNKNKLNLDSAKVEKVKDSSVPKILSNHINSKIQTKDSENRQDDTSSSILVVNKNGSQKKLDENIRSSIFNQSEVEQSNNKNNVIPMPLVNPKIYKQGNNKGLVPLLNKPSLQVEPSQENNKEKRKVAETNIMDVLKGSNIEKGNKIESKQNLVEKSELNKYENEQNAETNSKNDDKPQPKTLRDKRESGNDKELSSKICEKNENLEQLDDKSAIKNKINISKLANYHPKEDEAQKPQSKKKISEKLSQEITNRIKLQQSFAIEKSLSDDIELLDFDGINLLAGDLQKNANLNKVRKKR